MVHDEVGKSFIYIDIPFTGGDFLYTQFKQSPITEAEDHPSIKNPQRRTISDYSLYYDLSKYFTFSFVRNPYERLVDYYVNYEVRGNTFHNMSFGEFIKNYLINSVYSPLIRPQINFIVGINRKKIPIKVDYVGRYESLLRDWDFIQQKIGITDPTPAPIIVNPVPNYREYYTPELQEVVGNYYKQDLEVFKYKF